MKSTPIREMETLSGLQSIEDRRDSKTLIQEEKYKRLPSLPMFKRLRTQKSKPRLKRKSFIVNVKTLRKSMDISTDTGPEQVTVANPWPAWKTKTSCRNLRNNQWYRVKMNPSDISTKDKSTIEKHYPKQDWVRLYTDGSATDAIKNGGGGVFTEWLDGSNTSDAFPTGATCSNYKAEAEALIVAPNLIKSTPNSKNMKCVLLSDAKSVRQALNNKEHQSFPNVNQLLAEVASVSARLVLQWIPGHCYIKGNEQADSLAKEGSAMNQIETDMSLEESKTQIRTAIYPRWIENHPNYSKTYAYHRRNREGQTIIFRLRSGHNRLKKHMYAKFKIGTSPNCPCGNIAKNS